MRVKLSTLGCRLNEAEVAGWSRELESRGCRVAADGDPADLVVINTCAVTAEAVRKSRKQLRRLQRSNPRARFVISGCAVSLEDDDELSELGVDLIVHNRDKDRLVSIAREALALPMMPEAATQPGASALFVRGRQRAFVKIQDGCRYQCTFCITTRARGAERSRPIVEVCDEINRLVADGIKEVVLTGVHAAGYGSDIGSTLDRLLTAVLQDTDVARIRLGSVEPWDLSERFWSLFEDPRMMPHLHLPVQSGADSVLKRMARRCKTAEFRRLVGNARASVPGFNVTTDIIVGFPGETAAEWSQTLAFVEEIGFGDLHVFSYSRRAGTLAAAMPDQVSAAVKRERSRSLHALGWRLKRNVLEQQLGSVAPVLIEGFETGSDGKSQVGYTPNYLLVRTPSQASDRSNQVVPVWIDGVVGDRAARSEAGGEGPPSLLLSGTIADADDSAGAGAVNQT
jgi:threonylcarbamoyladenosine tRNA methylthiotransferase MtaB